MPEGRRTGVGGDEGVGKQAVEGVSDRNAHACSLGHHS